MGVEQEQPSPRSRQSHEETVKEEPVESQRPAAETRQRILDLWQQLPDNDREAVALELLRYTDVGRKLASGGRPFIPHYMWERTRESGR